MMQAAWKRCPCRTIAAAAHCDGIQDDSLVKLAQMGTWGLHTSNVYRQLLTYAKAFKKASQARAVIVE